MTERPLREHLRVSFGDDEVERVRERLFTSMQDEQTGQAIASSWRKAVPAGLVALGVAAAGALLAVGTLGGTTDAPEPGSIRIVDSEVLDVASAGHTTEEIALDDGSRVILGAGTRIEARLNDATQLALVQSNGRVEYRVQPNGPRRWEVDAGLATIDVIGTHFVVERSSTVVVVTVSRGVVRVRGAHVPDGLRRLRAGETIRVETPVPATTPEASEPRVVPETSIEEETPEPRTEPPQWRAFVQRGDYDRAYRELERRGLSQELARARDVDTLLAMADAARLSGHPRDALAPLGRISEDYARDPRAAVAAFTAARIHLDVLHQPGAAATSFARAIELGSPRGIRENAYARLAEARGAAGDRPGAAAAAREYVERYPHGQHEAAVRRWLASDERE